MSKPSLCPWFVQDQQRACSTHKRTYSDIDTCVMSSVTIGRGSLRVLDYFSGKWTFCRKIVNAATNEEVGTIVAGRASFERVETSLEDTKDLLYSESGQLKMRGISSNMEVTRQYLYRCLGDMSMKVFFYNPASEEDHMRFFHNLDFVEGKDAKDTFSACAEHLCVKDLYKVQMHLENSAAFEMRWEVKGPRKNNIIVTNFTRHVVEGDGMGD